MNNRRKMMLVASVLLIGTAFLCTNSASAMDIEWTKIAEFEGHTRPVVGVAISSDNKTLVSCDHRDARVWDVRREQLRHVLGQAKPGADEVGGSREVHIAASVVAITPPGNVVATGGLRPTITIWNTESGKEVRRLKSAGAIRSICFSPDGMMLAAGVDFGEEGNHVQVWDTATWKLRGTLKGHGGRKGPFEGGNIESLAFSSDTRKLASGSWDRTVRIWDVAELAHIKTLKYEGHVIAVDISPDGGDLVTTEWRRSKENLRRYDDFQTAVRNIESPEHVKVLDDKNEFIGVAYLPDDDGTVAVTFRDGAIRTWRDVDGESSRTDSNSMVRHMSLSRDGTILMLGGQDRRVRLWKRVNSIQ